MSVLRAIAVLIFLLLPGAVSYAQSETCGDIVVPAGYYDEESEEERQPIEDCTNPFNVDEAVGFTYQVQLGNKLMGNGRRLEVSATATELTGRLEYSYPDAYGSAQVVFYKKEGNDYKRAFSANEGDFVWTNIVEGEYVGVVVFEYFPILNDTGILNRFFAWVIPTAQAYYDDFAEVDQFTFTIERLVSEPTGASSVLFLPGIQASRLYKDGILGTEDQVWPPSANFGNDIHDLAMTTEGFSAEQIYTRDVIDSSAGVGRVYGGFLNFLENQKTAALPIKDYVAFAYDWRFDVNDIVLSGTQYESELKSAVSEIERLANESYTGRVSIIAHSNGGLLAKAIVRELEFQGEASLVDKIIFLGVPHLGTPKAIGTLLHGYDQTDVLGGIVVNAYDVRQVINNMPGVYGLLPSEKYFDSATDPVVSFESGAATDQYRSRYGEHLDSFSEYKDFLYGDDGFDRGLDEGVSNPVRVNRQLFDEALRRHAEIYDNWEAPEPIEVIEIVGVGLPTMKAATYRTVTERKCSIGDGGRPFCLTTSEIKPYAVLSKQGDATVVDISADGYAGKKQTLYLDLFDLNEEYRDRGLSSIEHYNLTESIELQTILNQYFATSTTPTVNFFSTSAPEFDGVYDVETIDSPVLMMATDEDGNRTGVEVVGSQKVILTEIPGSQYFEFGDTKYLVIPSGVERVVRLYGQAYGGYTLQTNVLDANDRLISRTKLVNATVTPTMVAEYEKLKMGIQKSKLTLREMVFLTSSQILMGKVLLRKYRTVRYCRP
jgi:hypothetical protein